MHAPRKRRIRQLDAPQDPGTVDDLLRFRERFGFDHRRDEIIEGLLVVSPLPIHWHEKMCRLLEQSLRPV